MRKLISALAILLTLSFASRASVVVDSVSFSALSERMAQIRKERPTVALVLSGGGAKGACVPGILKYMENKGVPVDMVLGVSIGGLIGAMYTTGYSVEFMDSLFTSLDWMQLLSDAAPRRYLSEDRRYDKETYALNLHFNGKKEAEGGLIKGIPAGIINGFNLYNLFSSLLVGYESPDQDYSDLPIPFVALSTDMNGPASVVMQKGDLVRSLRATMSIPYIFRPVRDGDMTLVDGGTMNNYPVDVARALGVDYVIGVDLMQSGEKLHSNSLIEFAFQSVICMGEDKYKENKDVVIDINIHPVLKGVNGLSFSPEAIAGILNDGYLEAQKHEKEFDELLKKLGTSCKKTLAAEKALDISKRSVLVDSICYENLNEEEIGYLLSASRIAAGRTYTSEDINDAVSVLYGTGIFEEVTYRLYGDKEPFTLVFKCVRSKKHKLSIGARADTEIALAAAARVGLWNNTLFGPKLDIAARFSISPYVQAKFRYLFKEGFGIGASLKASFNSVKGFGAYDVTKNYRRTFFADEASVFVCSGNNFPVAFDAGVKFVQTPFLKTSSLNGSSLVKDAGMFGASAFASIGYDSMDDAYFPTKGIAVRLNYDFLFAGKDVTASHYPALSFKAALPVGSRFAVIPQIDSRARLGGSGHLFFMDNYVGGRISGRYFDSQIAFFGVNGVRNCDDLLGVAQLALRYRITDSLFASLKGSFLCDGNKLSGANKPVWAAGVEAGYNTMFGPVFANLGWNSETKALCGYFGIGFDF